MLVQCTPEAGACASQIHIRPYIVSLARGNSGAPLSCAMARLLPPAVTETRSALAPLCAWAPSIFTTLSVCQVLTTHGAFGACPCTCASKSSQNRPGQPASTPASKPASAPASAGPASAPASASLPESAPASKAASCPASGGPPSVPAEPVQPAASSAAN